jgi:CRISPR-associated protein Csm2
MVRQQQEQDKAPFTFHLSELNEVFGRRERDKQREVAFLERWFEKWELGKPDRIAMSVSVLEEIITTTPEDENSQDAVKALDDWAKRVGAVLKSSQLTTSQIRGLFGTVRQIEMSWQRGASEVEARAAGRQLLLLKPKLAYQGQRVSSVVKLADLLSAAIDFVGTDRDRFGNFVDFFEAILAYHTAAGGQ